jgi:hypothetical protein
VGLSLGKSGEAALVFNGSLFELFPGSPSAVSMGK